MLVNRDLFLFENIPAGVSVTTPEGIFIDANQVLIDMLGYDNKEDFLKIKSIDIYADKNEREKLIEKLKKGIVKNYRIKGKRKNGEFIWLSISVNPTKNKDGKTEYIDIIEDITQEIELNRKVREKEELFQLLSEATFEAIFISEKGVCLNQNKTAEKMFGYTLLEATGKMGTDWIHPDHRELVMQNMISGSERPYEVIALRKDGSTFPAEIQGRMTRFQGKNIRITALRDISEQKNADLEKRKSQEQYRAIVETQNELICRWKPDGTRTFVNKAYADYYKKTMDELEGVSFVNDLNAESWKKLQQKINKLTASDPVAVNEHKSEINGKAVWKEWTDQALFDSKGNIYEIQSTGRIITERKLAEQKLKESETRYRILFEKSSDPTLLIEKGIFTECNKATVEYLRFDNKEEITGKAPWEHSPEFQPDGQLSKDKAIKLMEEVVEKGNNRFIWLHKDKYEKDLWVDVSLTLIPGDENNRIYTVWRDITSQRQADIKLLENQSLLKATLESTGEGILVVNNKGVVTHYNANFQKIWNIPEEIIQTNDDNKLIEHVLSQLKDPGSFLAKVKQLYKSNEIDYDTLDFKDGRKIERHSYPLIIENTVEGRVWSFNDITKQFEAQEKIRESEMRFKQLVENLPDAIFVTELGGTDKGKILDINPAAELQTGYTRDELLLKKIGDDLLEIYDEEKFAGDEETLLKEGKLRLVEKKRRKDNSIYWVEVIITTIVLYGRKVALAVNRDITELKKSEQALEESRKNLSLIYETAGVGLFRVGIKKDNSFYILSVNNTYLQITGRNSNEVVNKEVREFMLPQSAKIAIEKYNLAIKNKQTVSWEETSILPSGEKTGALSVTPVFNDNGECTSLIGVVHDITLKKQNEAQIIKSQEELEKLVHSRTVDLDRSRKAAMNLLQDSNEQRKIAEEALQNLKKSNAEIQRLSQAVEQNPAALLIINTEGNIEYANKYYTQKTGYSFDEISGKNPKIGLFSNTLPLKKKTIWDEINSGKTWSGEIEIKSKNEEIFWESVSISPLYDENNSIIGFIRVGQDITQRKKLEEDLIIAKEKADEATKAKSEFLANMSHEIRTPMNAILGFADLLSASISESNAKNYINSLKTSGKSLLNLINDILDLSKVEAGMLQLSYEFTNLRLLFEDIYQMFSIEIESKKLDFILELDNTLPTAVFLDEARLRQILINLVNNAVKFTDEGFIKLIARPENPINIQHNKKNYSINLLIEVEDSGIGISKEFQKIIFDSFTQHEGHDTKKHGGTGLGLAITQNLVKLMNGQISLLSHPGKGSKFSILLKNTLVSTSHIKKKKPENLGLNDIEFEYSTVLVVEDIYNNLEFICGILEFAGFRILKAMNGEDAINILNDETPDLIITDISMPVLNGIELLKYIRGSGKLKGIPVICLCSNIQDEKEKVFDKNDFDGFISKPVQIPELLMELTNHIKHKIIRKIPDEILEAEYLFEKIPENIISKVNHEIKAELMPLWEQIKERQPVKKVEMFGNKVMEIGIKYNIDGFVRYGKDIVEAINSFNIEGFVKLIKLFPDLIKKLR
ncbi:MAG: PAS domain S-box protein [Prolixibacteraceae bacterium]|nr:PAS domain S-box protein [Prolixibacteraceae bacterium]